ncbi:TPM domain-containing protein [Georgenia sp. Z1344]|uniref:TPM domain-containing protein n=1 Tax=Georgenia sp. Z1344 TaxID=3416706 RepID=UPI003CF7C688
MRPASRRPRRLAAPLGIAALALGPVLLAGPALAADPSNLPDGVLDEADVLSDAEEADLEALFDQIEAEHDVQPFIVYVSDFGGTSAPQWAEETAQLSNMSDDEVLLAIAVDESAYGVAVGENAPVSDGEVQSVIDGDVADHFNAGEWSELGTAWGEGLGDATGGIGIGGFLIGGVAVVAVGAVGFAAWRRKTGKSGAKDPLEGLPENHPARLPLPELRKEAGSALVGADDAVRSSAAELEFAKAQFGLRRTDEFTEALAAAQKAVDEAFQARRTLDDEHPESEDEERRLLLRILDRSEVVRTTLSSQQEEFERLRNIESRVEEVLEETRTRAEEVRGEVENSRIHLRALTGRYPASALASVKDDPEQAEQLLDSALRSVDEGLAAATRNRRAAVTHARVAEEAVHQAAELADRVAGAGQQLEHASANLAKAIASISSDVEDADRLARDNPGVRSAREEAVAAIAQGEEARQGGDPLAALDRLTSAETAIDEVLAPMRERAEVVRRNRSIAEGRIEAAERLHRSVDQLINTRRGAVGQHARTQVRGAEDEILRARSLLDSSPDESIRAAGRATTMLREAQQDVERDLASLQLGSGYGAGNPYGRGYHPRRGGVDVGSLVIGGIIGGLLGGGDDHHGGWGGGGGFGGGFGGGGGGGFGGSSFGGRF